jgi:hypothetical protein
MLMCVTTVSASGRLMIDDDSVLRSILGVLDKTD